MAKQDAQNEANAEQQRKVKLREAYTAAQARLRENHRDEFDTLREQEAQARGVEFTRKPSAEQKAEEQFAALLEQYPHLADKVAQGTVPVE